MHPAPFELEAFSTGDLRAEARSNIQKHVEACDGCRASLTELETEKQARLVTHPPAAFASRVVERAARTRRRPVWLGWTLALSAAAAAAVIVFAPRPEPAATLRTMGGADTVIFLRRAGAVERVGLRTEVAKGDAVQVVLTLPRPAHLSIFFIDEAGDVSWVLPYQSNEAPVAVGPGEWAAPASAVFDASLRSERAVIVLRDEPFAVADIAAEVRARLPANRLDFESGAWLRDIDGVTSALFVKR